MVEAPPEKPRIRTRSVIGTILGLVGTGATIVGGGILMSFHLLTVNDHNTRIAAGVTPIVVGAVMIVISLIIGVMDGYDAYKWWTYNKQHKAQPPEMGTAV